MARTAASTAQPASPLAEDGSTQEVSLVTDWQRRILFDALDQLEGEKHIVWDRSLMHRVNVLAGPSALRQHGVTKNTALDQLAASEPQHAHTLFLLAPTVDAVHKLAAYVKAVNDESSLYHVYFLPEAWYVARERLREDAALSARLESVQELPLWWLPRAGDALSLAAPRLASRLLLNGDWTELHRCARALHALMSQCPHVPPIHTKGNWSRDVASMIGKMRANEEPVSAGGGWLRINRLVIMDRWLDPLTPLLTQLTYSGLIDECFGIGMVGSIKVSEQEWEESGDAPDQLKEIHLNDELSHRLKHTHIDAIGGELGAILAEIRQDESFDKEKMSVAEYQLLVKRMPWILKRKKLAATHLRLAELCRARLFHSLIDTVRVEKELLESPDGDRAHPHIEECVSEARQLNSVLRLIGIQSLTAGGLKPAVLQHYRRLIMLSYGVEALSRLLKLQKTGVVRERSERARFAGEYSPPLLFQQQCKAYRLLPDDVSMTHPSDAAYAYSGYAPLLVRMVEEGDKLRWAGWNTQQGDGTHAGDGDTALFIVGGATRAELAALRLLPRVSLVSASAILTGDFLLEIGGRKCTW